MKSTSYEIFSVCSKEQAPWIFHEISYFMKKEVIVSQSTTKYEFISIPSTDLNVTTCYQSKSMIQSLFCSSCKKHNHEYLIFCKKIFWECLWDNAAVISHKNTILCARINMTGLVLCQRAWLGVWLGVNKIVRLQIMNERWSIDTYSMEYELYVAFSYISQQSTSNSKYETFAFYMLLYHGYLTF